MPGKDFGEAVKVQPWQRLDSEELFTSKWLRLRRDVCRLPGGSIIDDYYVLELPDGVTVVAITANKELVLVRQYKHALGQVVLELPAGIVNDGEDRASAMSRELAEETGYVAPSLEYVGTVVSKPARMSARTLVYFAPNVRRQAEPQESDTERIVTVLVPVEQVRDLVTSGSIVTESSLAALLMAWDEIEGIGARSAE